MDTLTTDDIDGRIEGKRPVNILEYCTNLILTAHIDIRKCKCPRTFINLEPRNRMLQPEWLNLHSKYFFDAYASDIIYMIKY